MFEGMSDVEIREAIEKAQSELRMRVEQKRMEKIKLTEKVLVAIRPELHEIKARIEAICNGKKPTTEIMCPVRLTYWCCGVNGGDSVCFDFEPEEDDIYDLVSKQAVQSLPEVKKYIEAFSQAAKAILNDVRGLAEKYGLNEDTIWDIVDEEGAMWELASPN